MKHLLSIIGFCLISMGFSNGASAQAVNGFIYLYAFCPSDSDPMPSRRTTWNSSISQLSAEDAKEMACSGLKSEFERWGGVCASQPSFRPFQHEPRLRDFSCSDYLAVHKHNYESCIAPANSVSCKGGFYAVSESRASLTVGDNNKDPTAVGSSCGKKTQAEAVAAARKVCQSNVEKRGLTYNKLCP